MMHLLSDSDSDTAIKIIFGVIVAVIWIVGGIMSSMKKKASQFEQQVPQQDWNNLLRDLSGGQNKPFTPSITPPPLPPLPPQQQYIHRQQVQQQNRPFVQQNPRPFVQQYRQPAPRRAAAMAPKPIQRKPKPQRRPQPAPPVQISAPAEEQHSSLVETTTGPLGHLTSAQTTTARTSTPRLTTSQLRKLIIWSEVLAPPLALRETSPR
jgi:hypothetical protein